MGTRPQKARQPCPIPTMLPRALLFVHKLIKQYFLIWRLLIPGHPNKILQFQLLVTLLSVENISQCRSLLVSCLSTTEMIFLKATCASRTTDIRQPRSVHPWYMTFRITRFWVTAPRVLNPKMYFVLIWNYGEVQKTSSSKLRTFLLTSATSSVITVSNPAPLSVFRRMSKKKYRQTRNDSVAKPFLESACLSVCLSVCNSEQSTGSISVKSHRNKPH